MQFQIKEFKPVYRDEYTGDELPHGFVVQAMIEELSYFNKIVWELVPLADAKAACPESKPIRTRWVISNKGDRDHPDVRARLVACEINTFKTDMFAASTPPLEAKKLLFSMMASLRKDAKGRPLELAFIDVKKAYFNAVPKRVIHLVPPKEPGLPSGGVAHLRRCAYGTRDAGALWEEHYASVLTNLGFIRGRASPTCFFHPTKRISVVVHGDDFVALGPMTASAGTRLASKKHSNWANALA